MPPLFPNAENNPFREDHFNFLESKSFAAVLPAEKQTAADQSHTYRVPKKFGMSGMLAITTLMAIIFGIIHNFPGGLSFSLEPNPKAHPIAYIFLSVLVLTTCLAQMLNGDMPRVASCLCGAVLLPICIMCAASYRYGFEGFAMSLCSSPFSAIAGAGFGYLAGGCTAGCFLLMDKFDHWYMQRILKRPAFPPDDEPLLAEIVEDSRNHLGDKHQ